MAVLYGVGELLIKIKDWLRLKLYTEKPKVESIDDILNSVQAGTVGGE